MKANELKFVLQELNFSAEMPADVLDALATSSEWLSVPTNQVLFREGGDNDHLYLVHSGKLALEMNIPGRGRVRILTLGPGEMAGWSSLLGQGKMTACAVAVQETQVLRATGQQLSDLCESNHEFGYHLMRQMANALSKRLVATRLQLRDLFADDTSAQLLPERSE